MCDGQSIPVEMSSIPWELGSMAKSMGREEDVHLQAVSSDVAAHVMRGIEFPKDCVKQFKEFEIKTEGGWYVFGSQRKQQEESRREERCGWQVQSLSGRCNLGWGGRAGTLTMPGERRGFHSQRCHHPRWRHRLTLGDLTLGDGRWAVWGMGMRATRDHLCTPVGALSCAHLCSQHLWIYGLCEVVCSAWSNTERLVFKI